MYIITLVIDYEELVVIEESEEYQKEQAAKAKVVAEKKVKIRVIDY